MRRPDSAWMIWSDEAVWSEAQSIRAWHAVLHRLEWGRIRIDHIYQIYRRINQQFPKGYQIWICCTRCWISISKYFAERPWLSRVWSFTMAPCRLASKCQFSAPLFWLSPSIQAPIWLRSFAEVSSAWIRGRRKRRLQSGWPIGKAWFMWFFPRRCAISCLPLAMSSWWTLRIPACWTWSRSESCFSWANQLPAPICGILRCSSLRPASIWLWPLRSPDCWDCWKEKWTEFQ